MLFKVWYNISRYSDEKEETTMAVLAVPVKKSFEVSSDKAELFKKDTKDFNGRQIALDRLKKHSKGDVLWDLKK